MKVSWGDEIPTYGKMKHVPNHQAVYDDLHGKYPSGKQPHWKNTILNGKTSLFPWPFSIAMTKYKRVIVQTMVKLMASGDKFHLNQ